MQITCLFTVTPSLTCTNAKFINTFEKIKTMEINKSFCTICPTIHWNITNRCEYFYKYEKSWKPFELYTIKKL